MQEVAEFHKKGAHSHCAMDDDHAFEVYLALAEDGAAPDLDSRFNETVEMLLVKGQYI
jgi:hypothetical protein